MVTEPGFRNPVTIIIGKEKFVIRHEDTVHTNIFKQGQILFKLADPHTDVIEMYCSPVEMEYYYESFGNAASGIENDEN